MKRFITMGLVLFLLIIMASTTSKVKSIEIETEVLAEVQVEYAGMMQMLNLNNYVENVNDYEVTYYRGSIKVDGLLEIGTYKIILSSQTKKIEIPVKVVDTTLPIIVAPKQRYLMSYYEHYDLLSQIVVYDLDKYELSINDDAVNYNSIGVYPIELIATDASGNRAVTKAELALIDMYYSAPSSLDYDYANMTYEEIIESYLKENNIEKKNISLIYQNFVTDDKYQLNPSVDRFAASTYKFPVNMVVYSELNQGKYDSSVSALYNEYSKSDGYTGRNYEVGDYIPLWFLLSNSILYSDNTASLILVDFVGGWYSFKNKAERLTGTPYNNQSGHANYVRPDYMLSLLEYLYDNQESYERIIYLMKGTFPYEFFNLYMGGDIPIAHKPGQHHNYCNDLGIIFTDQPFALVVYTEGYHEDTGFQIIGDLVQISYYYNQYHIIESNTQ